MTYESISRQLFLLEKTLEFNLDQSVFHGSVF